MLFAKLLAGINPATTMGINPATTMGINPATTMVAL
jgi:hypothetical protein